MFRDFTIIATAFGAHIDELKKAGVVGAISVVGGVVLSFAVGAIVAAGLTKSVLVMVGTPFVATRIGLNNPYSAMIYGGLMGTTSGVAAGLAATDPKLVPYGAMTATFYTGVGCLLAPSVRMPKETASTTPLVTRTRCELPVRVP